MAKLEVFVSHRTTEAKFADVLCARLAYDFIGIPRFFVSTDVTSVPAGSQWFQELLAGLRRAELLLAVCSPESVKLPWINYEIGGACARGVEVIPLCHSGMTPEQLPLPLGMLEAVRLTEARDLAKLYGRVAALIGSNVPAVDFEGLSAAFTALDIEHAARLRVESSASGSGDAVVRDPRVLCVSSQQYIELGFQNQLQTVLDAFPKDLRHDVVTSSRRLVKILSTEQVDIVHIAAFVCPRSGTLYFSPVELPRGRAVSGEPEDFVRADALAMLLRDARTRLVVIASGDSLALATLLLPQAHVISPRDIISARAMAMWVEMFYAALKTETLAEACELASAQSGASMKLLMQQVPSPIKFAVDGDPRAAGA